MSVPVQVRNVKAEAHSRGGQIDLSWTYPSVSKFPDLIGVKILRHDSAYPDAASFEKENGIYHDCVLPHRINRHEETGRFSDTDLKGETIYYYAIAAYDRSDPPNYFPVYVSAMSTTGYTTSEQLYASLPAIYQKFDTVLPPDAPQLETEDLQKGQLNRLMDMFGSEFDVLRSYASGMQNFFNVDRIDGALLPLLAQWVGWQTDFSLPFDKQRNEIKYAPHFYRTTGIAANLRASLNRITTWNAQIKEYFHNILVTNNPEQLTIREQHFNGDEWKESELVTLDAAYEGRPIALTDQSNTQQQWLFYHARQSVPATDKQNANADTASSFFHIWYKICNYGEWLPAQRVTLSHGCNKYPSPVQWKEDGNFLVFYSALEETETGERIPQIMLNMVAAGRPAQPARIESVAAGPAAGLFQLAEGDQLKVTLSNQTGSRAEVTTQAVTFHAEDFKDITRATAAEVSALLNRRLSGVEVSRGDSGSIIFTSVAANTGLSITAEGTAAAKLGLPGENEKGNDALAAQLNLGAGPFSLKDGDTLALKVDGNLPSVVVFERPYFKDIRHATAAEIVSVIKRSVPGLAKIEDGHLKLSSQTIGAASSIVVDINASTAAPALGLGVPLPPANPPAADSEPAAFKDHQGSVWVFWTSLREGQKWKIWYNRFDGTSWGASRPLTSAPDSQSAAEREPAVLFDSSGGGKIWVFWSGKRYATDGKRSIGYWNIFYRTTTNLDFNSLKESDWVEQELQPDSSGKYDNQEPAVCLAGADRVELYFSSNRSDGLNIWSTALDSGRQEKVRQITTGQYTHRAPAVLRGEDHGRRLLYRTNESIIYNSRLYPAARTMDARYSGSTTIDTRNPAKFSIKGSIDDVMHYTYEAQAKNGETRAGSANRYASNKVGIYLTPDTHDSALIVRKQSQIENLLDSYLPINVQAVLIIRQVIIEVVYPFDDPRADQKSLVRDEVWDTITGEVYRGLQDEFVDGINVHWLRTWDASHGETVLPDLQVLWPNLLSFQLWTWDESHSETVLPDLRVPKPDLSSRLYISNMEEASYVGEVYRGLRDERHDSIGSHWLCTWSQSFPDTFIADLRTGVHDLSARLYIKGMEEATYEGDVYSGLKEEHFDRVNFRWFRMMELKHKLPDLEAEQPDLSSRLFLKGVKEGD